MPALAEDQPPVEQPKGVADKCPPAPLVPTTKEQLQEGLKAARDRGFLWYLRKDGRTSYLYGTLHVGKPEWVFPGPKLLAALRETQVLALELDITDKAIHQAIMAAQKTGDAWSLSPALSKRLARQAIAACVPERTFAALSPNMQAATYTLLAARWDGLDASFGQDFVLAELARSIGRPIVSLETPAQQLAALSPADPKRAKEMLEQMLDQLEQDRVRPVMARLAAVWASGDLAALENYPSWCDCANSEEDLAFLRQVNDDRNDNLAAQIEMLHAQGKATLVAVGALHMTGEKALTKLLAQRGFQLEWLNVGDARVVNPEAVQ